jgi:vitamin B12 transporter
LLVKTFIQHSQYKADIDAGVFADDKDYTINNSNLSSGAGVNFKKGIVNITANYQYGELQRRYLNDSLFPRRSLSFVRNNYAGRTQYAELYGNVNIASWLTLLAGSDYRWATMNQQYFSISSFGPYSSSFGDTSVHQTSFYGSLLFSTRDKKANVEIGGRINKHSLYGTNTTYTFNPSVILTKNWRLFASIASGFKAPSIFQVFDLFSGNTELEPERSANYEIGIQQQYKKFSSRIVLFNRRIKNGIDYNYVTFQYFNFVKQEVTGLEFEVLAQPIKQLSISANYTALLTRKEQTESRKNFSDTMYHYLLRRPNNALNVTIGYQICPDLFASVSGKSVGKRYDIGGYMAPDVLLDSYFIISAYAEYKWKNLKFFADLQNITDKKFEDIRGYTTIPFLINGGITFSL